RLKELEGKMGAADFWNNQETAQPIVNELKQVKAVISPVSKVNTQIEEAVLLWEMANDADDDASREEVDSQIDKIRAELDRIENLSRLSGKYDARNCYLSIYAREGGTEAQDWTEMLFRMYLLYCEASGFDVSEVDKTLGEEAGLKDVTLYIQ